MRWGLLAVTNRSQQSARPACGVRDGLTRCGPVGSLAPLPEGDDPPLLAAPDLGLLPLALLIVLLHLVVAHVLDHLDHPAPHPRRRSQILFLPERESVVGLGEGGHICEGGSARGPTGSATATRVTRDTSTHPRPRPRARPPPSRALTRPSC